VSLVLNERWNLFVDIIAGCFYCEYKIRHGEDPGIKTCPESNCRMTDKDSKSESGQRRFSQEQYDMLKRSVLFTAGGPAGEFTNEKKNR
jgi:hypothetical protein